MWLNFVVVYMLVKVQEIHMGNLSEKRAKIILLLTSDWSGFSGYSVPRGWYFVSCNQNDVECALEYFHTSFMLICQKHDPIKKNQDF